MTLSNFLQTDLITMPPKKRARESGEESSLKMRSGEAQDEAGGCAATSGGASTSSTEKVGTSVSRFLRIKPLRSEDTSENDSSLTGGPNVSLWRHQLISL